MTLEETLLQKLSEWQPPPGRHTLTVPATGWTVSLTADRCDVLGCLAWELTLQRKGSSTSGLRTWADRIADRVTGLLEPLKVHEVDEPLNQAQLRSGGPTQRGDKLGYYEVVLNGTTSAIVRRYQASQAGG